MSKSMMILVAAAAVASGAAGALALRGQSTKPTSSAAGKTSCSTTGPAACCAVLPKRFAAGTSKSATTQPSGTPLPAEAAHAGMKWLAGGEFAMGGHDPDGRADEQPVHRVRLDGFWIDQTLVTNSQFRQFVDATGYVTTAEKKPDWEEMKKQLPPETPKPSEDKLVAASIVFHSPSLPVPLDDVSQWWQWVPGADWRHPQGPGSSIDGRDNYPVVQVSWDDASAFARWAQKRLPTEAQFEYAARGGLQGRKYAWGDQDPSDDDVHPHCNIWQGHFPDHNTAKDGYERSSPVTAFPPNGYGLYDMAGNVWEWCSDWYRPDTYATDAARGTVSNPTGPESSLDPDEPYTPKHVTRGGSFLCHASYCSSYRAAARMNTSPDSSTDHTGFRCVMVRP